MRLFSALETKIFVTDREEIARRKRLSHLFRLTGTFTTASRLIYAEAWLGVNIHIDRQRDSFAD